MPNLKSTNHLALSSGVNAVPAPMPPNQQSAIPALTPNLGRTSLMNWY